MSNAIVIPVRAALKAHLTTQLSAFAGGVTILDRWPQPNVPLPKRCIAITSPDAEVEDRRWPPEAYEWTGTVAPAGTVRYTSGEWKLPMQIDVWADGPGVLSSLMAALKVALTIHPSITLGTDDWPRNVFWPELVLSVSETMLGTVVIYRFPLSANPVDTPEAAVQREFHSRLTGDATGYYVQEDSVTLQTEADLLLGDETFPVT